MTLRKTMRAFTVILALVLISIQTFGWGFWAHKEITRNAIRILPEPMQPFFNANSDYIAEHSVDPDMARRADSLEQFNHYLDIDYYGHYPFDELPRNYEDAVRKFTADTLREYGLLPWKIAEFTHMLSDAMRQGDKQAILKNATYLAHYVEDSFVPLHATLNYDGQMSNQKGIHRRFESDVPERYGRTYHYDVSEPVAEIQDPLAFAFETILQSYIYVDSVLEADRRTNSELPSDKIKVEVEDKGKNVTRYSAEYYERLNELLNDLPRRRMEAAIAATARYWYTAWLNAGEPTLMSE
ncbi:MAG: zinc dependent phospholipase C family protein [Ignavibacteriae bacterium]|nr:zinc dependent phospholipase C family protein [Ignavibacteriota bacterium]